MRLSFGVGKRAFEAELPRKNAKVTEDVSKMNSSVKKKLIQKIRNRMSAQRSRMKQKLHYKNLEAKNRFLTAKINELSIRNSQLLFENSQLKQQVFSLQKLYSESVKPESPASEGYLSFEER